MTGPPPSRFAVVAAETEAAKQALEELHDRYLSVPPGHAELLLLAGGCDGGIDDRLGRPAI